MRTGFEKFRVSSERFTPPMAATSLRSSLSSLWCYAVMVVLSADGGCCVVMVVFYGDSDVVWR